MQIKICGATYSIITEDDAEYVEELGDFIDSEMKNISSQNPSLSSIQCAVLVALDQADACRRETRSFLDRLYGGSLGLMVSTLVGTEALTPDDVEELEELLQRAKEAKRHDESQ